MCYVKWQSQVDNQTDTANVFKVSQDFFVGPQCKRRRKKKSEKKEKTIINTQNMGGSVVRHGKSGIASVSREDRQELKN